MNTVTEPGRFGSAILKEPRGEEDLIFFFLSLLSFLHATSSRLYSSILNSKSTPLVDS